MIETIRQYDVTGRLIKRKLPNGTVIEACHDKKLLTITRANGKARVQHFRRIS